ncbi:hypothetical protein Tco_1363772, partial [Tanacetum coccineum]
MVPNTNWLLERYIEGIPLNIKGNVTSSKLVDLHEASESAQGLKAKGKKFGCEYFVWEDELCLCKCGHGLCHAFKNQKGVTHICPQIGEKNCGFCQFIGTAVLKARSSPVPARSRPVPARSSPAPKIAEASCSSPGSSSGLEANCSNCKHLMLKISLLQAKLDLARGLDCRLDELLA